MDLDQRHDGGIEAEIEAIAGHDLPPRVAEVAADYEAHGGHRDRFLWKWIHAVLPHVTLSSVPPAHRQATRDAKTVASMFVVLVDDVGECNRDRATLNEASKCPFAWQSTDADRPDVDSGVLGLADRIWSRFEAMVAEAPRAAEFREILEFDLAQTLNAVQYSYVVNENLAMANEAEHWMYECNNMMLFPYADVDLMFSPAFDRADLSVVRRTVRRAQRMARIGNWITTWERELDEGDLTSGVVVSALERGVVSRDELADLQNGAGDDDVARIVDAVKDHRIEQRLLDAWGLNHREARGLVSRTDSVDLDDYLDGMETVLQYHLISEGLK